MQLKRTCVVNFLSASPVKVVATTENVGRRGALIRLEERLAVEVGAHVEVELMLNGRSTPNRKCMYFRGVVTRVLAEPGKPARIGVQFDYVDFRDSAVEVEYVPATAIM
jgi:PilZ domain-containing protein